MRTSEEIIARIKAVADDDFFGTQFSDLVSQLDFADAKTLIAPSPDFTEATWSQTKREDPLESAKSYLDFAWDKALDHRGLSASRSIEHFRSWLWLAGRDDLVAVCEDESKYQPYGAPILAAISQALGVALPAAAADAEDVALMAAGKPCVGCASRDREGCY